MTQPIFDTYGVGPHYLNERIGERARIVARANRETRESAYIIEFPDGYRDVAFAEELRFLATHDDPFTLPVEV